MCGIFGLVLQEPACCSAAPVRQTIERLFRLSETRGREAAGIAIARGDRVAVYKEALTPSVFVRQPEYRRLMTETLGTDRAGEALAIIGHSRLVTNGAQERSANNQPVVADESVAVHNGIICNVDDLCARHPHLQRTAEVDTEVLLRLVEAGLADGDVAGALRTAFREIEGTASIGVLFRDRPAVLLATNNGSLYTWGDAGKGACVFASERYILERLQADSPLPDGILATDIEHCAPRTALLVRLDERRAERFALEHEATRVQLPPPTAVRRLVQLPSRNGAEEGRRGARVAAVGRSSATRLQRLLEEGHASVPTTLRRCTRCILPETMPALEFDAEGVCSYCRRWRPIQIAGAAALEAAVAQFRGSASGPNCVVALSGGRDSTYALHYIQRVLGLRPVAYTYDWGMVTDLARRNQARICGRLGVEHILVSADIQRKRENIRKNVAAWLRSPDLGTVPLFMAGDKQFFYYANRLREQMRIQLLIFSMNPLEKTDFKTGFCGVTQSHVDERFYSLSLAGKMQLAGYYLKQCLRNPAYLNSSLLDTLHAYWSYYFLPQDYLQFFQYLDWDEATINRTLIEEYDWELAPDTKSTWRIGDGTAPFYNYVYHIGAGFTEHDTFRSNQIRQGKLTREVALAEAQVENQPRLESFQWYCDTIGIDTEAAIRAINAMPRRYQPVRPDARRSSAG